MDKVYSALNKEKIMYDIKDIKKIIPHREPFLLIDRVEECQVGESARAIKNVTYNEYFFSGHFPEEPLMPGVLIVEALAQTGAFSILSHDDYKGKIAYFAGLDKVKFKNKVVPGDTLTLDVEIIKKKGPLGIGKGRATVDGKLAVSCELKFFIG
jgi:3-hydroxyacyl-[acyl-carrier-protein] dehydratase